ncbi:hypothetical protein YC2023_091492 [Brassica napus]
MDRVLSDTISFVIITVSVLCWSNISMFVAKLKADVTGSGLVNGKLNLQVLSSKLNVGHFPHLADLVTRISYNYHCMPDTGSLKTASGAETKSSRTWTAKSDV